MRLSPTPPLPRPRPGTALKQSIPGIRRLRYAARSYVSGRPALYLPFARRKYPGPEPQVIGPGCEFVIDGYTRAGCTFAVYAFQLAQLRPVKLAHHLHAPAQLIVAARRQIPALLLIREPRGAILSQIVREPYVDLSDALRAYIRFYDRLWPYRLAFVVGDYRDTTRDFGAVIRRVNDRFGTAYGEFDHTEANVQVCLDMIRDRSPAARAQLAFESGLISFAEVRDQRRRHPEAFPASQDGEAWVPSAARDRQKDLLLDRWSQPDLAALRGRAERTYERFVVNERSGE